MTTTTFDDRALTPVKASHTRRWLAILALAALLLVGTIGVQAVANDDAGAWPDSVSCVVGGLTGAGSVALFVAFPPAGLVEIVASAGLGFAAAAAIADSCGAWWSTDLGEVIHLYVRAGTTGGGGSW